MHGPTYNTGGGYRGKVMNRNGISGSYGVYFLDWSALLGDKCSDICFFFFNYPSLRLVL
jgi:hypothetical protein